MTYVHEEVDVNAFYFAGKDMRAFPRQISFGGRAVKFADGLRVSLAQDGKLTYLFNMMATDGASYRLRQDGNQWTLLGV